MTKDEVIAVLKILKTSYPRFYANMTKDEMISTIDLWTEMFEHENPALVAAAVKNLINTFKWPPTIADIKEHMYKLTEQDTDTPIELYNSIKKAISNSNYNSFKEFEKLPELCKKFVGTPSQLKEWALDPNFNDGVLRGQFLKQFEILKQREKDNKLMLPETKQIVQDLLNNTSHTQNLLN